MPIYRYKCLSNGHEFERICSVDLRKKQLCGICGASGIIVPAVHGPNCSNDSASWIPSVLEVVAKDDPRPHVRNFLKDPTRANYRAWMKGEGIRHLEPGEKNEKFEFDTRRHADKIMEMKMRRERLEIRG